MNKPTLLLILFSFAIFSACNNSSQESEADKKMSHDSMDHELTSTSSVPELPAIPDGAEIHFKNVKDGDKVSALLDVEMGVINIRVDTAGPVVAGSGHHHLFIDADFLPEGTIIPKDAAHMHFGRGDSTVELKLSPGNHKLTLQFADGLHRSYGKKLSSTITVNVE